MMMIPIKEKGLKRDIHDDHLMSMLSRLPVRSFVRFGSVSKKWLSLTRDPFFMHHLMSILSRLPVRSLVRFGSVSKKWLSVTRDPLFIRMHHSHIMHEKNPNPSFAQLALKDYYDRLESFNLTKDDEEPVLNGLGGMVQIRKSPSNDMNFGIAKLIDVKEFIIRRGSTSPPHTYHSALRPCCGLLGFQSETHVLVVNPTTQELKHVFFDDWEEDDVTGFVNFGFDPAAMKFKLVLLVLTKSGINRCDVLRLESSSSSSSEWETVDISTRKIYDITACIDGILYFLAYEENTLLIVRFDLSREAFDTEGVLVPLQSETGEYHQLHELEGCLCLTFMYHVEQSAFVDIWVLKDTTTSTNGIWEKKHSMLVPQTPTPPYARIVPLHIEILWVSKKKVWFCRQFCHLYCYDVLARTYSRVLFGWEKRRLEWVGGFVESMLSIGF